MRTAVLKQQPTVNPHFLAFSGFSLPFPEGLPRFHLTSNFGFQKQLKYRELAKDTQHDKGHKETGTLFKLQEAFRYYNKESEALLSDQRLIPSSLQKKSCVAVTLCKNLKQSGIQNEHKVENFQNQANIIIPVLSL